MTVIFLLFFVILLLLVIYRILNDVERFMMFNIPSRYICPTRNQSYDMRGDAAVIPRVELPVNNSEFGPYDPIMCQQRRMS